MQSEIRKTESSFNLYLATCTISTLGISLGTSLSWTSPIIPRLLEPNDHIWISKLEASYLSSFLSLGGFFGPVLNMLLVDRIGRKYTLFLYGCCMTISWTLLAFSTTVEIMCAARFLNGLTAGPTFSLLPMYIAEISTATKRGITATFVYSFMNFGCCISYFIGPYTSYFQLTSIYALIALTGTLSCLLVPESPCFLITKNNIQEAYNAVKWLLGSPDKTIIEWELNSIREGFDKSIQKKDISSNSLQSLLNLRNIKCFYYCLVVIFIQQNSGMSAVVFFSEILFRLTGSSISATGSSMICGVVMQFAAFLPMYFSKILRVKSMLKISATGCCLCMIMLSLFFYLQEKHTSIPVFNLIPIISVVAFIVFFTFGIGTYTVVIVIEILPISLKVNGNAVFSMYSSFLGFMFTRFFIIMNDMIGSTGTFAYFSLVCGIGALFFSFQLPDTQGLTFSEIEQLIKYGKNKFQKKDYLDLEKSKQKLIMNQKM